uniref:phosphoinositide phospholipase C n=1 Tax=Romanomermis culicivorax TaxID=13658 RepID=A0A915I2G5_ROMCU
MIMSVLFLSSMPHSIKRVSTKDPKHIPATSYPISSETPPATTNNGGDDCAIYGGANFDACGFPCAVPRYHASTRLYTFNGDLEQIFQSMERGTRVNKIFLNRRGESSLRHCCVKRETRQLLLYKISNAITADAAAPQSLTPLGNFTIINPKYLKSPVAIDMLHVKEIKTLEHKLNYIRFVDKWRSLQNNYDPAKLLVINYGSQFVLNLAVSLTKRQQNYNWFNGMELSKMCCLPKRWEQIYITVIVTQNDTCNLRSRAIGTPPEIGHYFFDQKVALKDLKPFIQQRLQFKITSKALQSLAELFTDRFSNYSVDGKQLNFASLVEFFVNEQKDHIIDDEEKCNQFLTHYVKGLDISRDIAQPYLTIHEFTDFLFSKENSIWDPRNDDVIQDMDQPLSMDVWDGQKRSNTEAEIVIYHGYTMTTKLNLRDVLCTIKEYAFVTSEYPIILSIEDNCTVALQRQLAHDLKEILGDFLVTSQVDKDEKQLPTPEQLKRRIIEWHPHIFVLFADRLCYTSDMNLLIAAAVGSSGFDAGNQFLPAEFENPGLITPLSVAGAGSASSDEDAPQENDSPPIIQSNPDELHLTEEWFHGKISRDQAVALLKDHRELGDGLFLVRESTTFVGDYSLSFLHCGEAHHCRIKSTLTQGAKYYYLLECKKMDTLYELISYYQQHQLTTPKFRAHLVTPCPQPSPHIGQPWFAGDIDRQKSEDMLNAHPLDGSFLIRYSGSGDNVFTLSFRVDGLIKHGRLKREGRMFVVGSHQFENLNLMIEYYSTHELYHGVSLKYAVNAETIENYSREVTQAPQGCYLDLQTIDNKQFYVRAKSAHKAIDSRVELSFPVGAVICITQKEDGFW